MTEYLVLDTGFRNKRTHWTETLFLSGIDNPESDWIIAASYAQYPWVAQQIPNCHGDRWESLFITRHAEKILLFRQMTCCSDFTIICQIVAFTNSENFWTYFVLKYR